jgi:hypothetical protein
MIPKMKSGLAPPKKKAAHSPNTARGSITTIVYDVALFCKHTFYLRKGDVMTTVFIRLEFEEEQTPEREQIAELLQEVAHDIANHSYERATWKNGAVTLHYAIRPGTPPEDNTITLP